MRTNPFVGLRPYETEEAELFFGRDELINDLLVLLHRTRFVGVVGGSGSGKSSLIRAGLLPELKAGFLAQDRDRWVFMTLKPGDRPLRSLAESVYALTQEGLEEKQSERVLDDIENDIESNGLEAMTTRLKPSLDEGPSNLLLLVDQFEEVFTHAKTGFTDPDHEVQARDFVSIMLGLAKFQELPTYVVMTMRSDYIGDCDAFPGLPEALNASSYLVPRLDRRQRRAVIEGPIRLFGAKITDDLVAVLLREIRDDNDQLPVLQYALMRTWSAWRDKGAVGPIDVEFYQEAGRIAGAINREAERAYNDPRTAELYELTKRTFQSLTQFDANNRAVRRPLRFDKLTKVTGGPPEHVDRIIDVFAEEGRSFLTRSSHANPLVDISHESLIRQWRRLEGWAREEHVSAETYRELLNPSTRWEERRRGLRGFCRALGGLWRGLDLRRAIELKKQRNSEWATLYGGRYGLVTQFVRASRVWAGFRWGFFGLVASAAVMLAMGIQSSIAIEGKKAPAGLLTWMAKNGEKGQTDATTAVLALEAFQIARDLGDDEIESKLNSLWQLLHDSHRDSFFSYRVPHHADGIRLLALSPTGNRLVTVSGGNTVRQWDLQALHSAPTSLPLAQYPESVAFSRDRKILILTRHGQRFFIRGWDKDGNDLEQKIEVPAPRRAATVPASPAPRFVLDAHGDVLAVADRNMISLYDLSKGGLPQALLELSYRDGQQRATIELSDSSHPAQRTVTQVFPNRGFGGNISALAFNPAGNLLFFEKNLQLYRWDMKEKDRLTTVGKPLSQAKRQGDIAATHRNIGKTRQILSLGISNGDKFVTLDRTEREPLLHVWGARENDAFVLDDDISGFSLFAVSADGSTVVSGDYGGELRLWIREKTSSSTEDSSDDPAEVGDLPWVASTICQKLRRPMSSEEWKKFIDHEQVAEHLTASCPGKASYVIHDAVVLATLGKVNVAKRLLDQVDIGEGEEATGTQSKIKEIRGELERYKQAGETLKEIESHLRQIIERPTSRLSQEQQDRKQRSLDQLQKDYQKVLDVDPVRLALTVKQHKTGWAFNFFREGKRRLHATPPDKDNAEKLFDVSRTLDPGFDFKVKVEMVNYYLSRGEREAKEHDVEAALASYDKAKENGLSPDRERIFQINVCQWGSLAKDTKQVKAALPICDAAVREETGDLDIGSLFNRAVVRARTGNIEGAEQDWRAFIQADKNFLEKLRNGVPEKDLQELRRRAYQLQAAQKTPIGSVRYHD